MKFFFWLSGKCGVLTHAYTKVCAKCVRDVTVLNFILAFRYNNKSSREALDYVNNIDNNHNIYASPFSKAVWWFSSLQTNK